MRYYSKFFLLALSLCCGLAVFAQTTTVKIHLTAEKRGNSEIMLSQDSKYSVIGQNGTDELPLNGVPTFPNVAIFVETLDNKYTTVCANALVGTKLSFYTNNSKKYTLTFSAQTGEVLYLRDTKNDTEIKMVPSVSYEFSVEDNEVSYTDSLQMIVRDRFEIVTPSTPQPTEYKICYSNGYLQISSYPTDQNTNHIVIRDENSAIVKDKNGKDIDVAPLAPYQEIDLRHLTSGHYTIEANGETLTIGVK